MFSRYGERRNIFYKYWHYFIGNRGQFLLVLIISMLASTLLWYSHKCSEVLEPYLVVLNSLPKSALAPLFIVWLGTGINTIIVAGISVAVFGSIINL